MGLSAWSVSLHSGMPTISALTGVADVCVGQYGGN